MKVTIRYLIKILNKNKRQLRDIGHQPTLRYNINYWTK